MNRTPIRTTFAACLILAAFSVFAQNAGSGAPFRQEGIASWYGSEYDGKPTASGEIFDSKLETAAHPTLPFGTMLRVTNTQNGKMTIVRVNDRGPFVAARIADVSRAAAEKLDMLVTGTAPVVIETADAVPAATVVAPLPASTELASEAAAAAPSSSPAALILPGPVDPASGKRYRLQVGSYRMPKYAAEAFEKLKNAGFAPAYERAGELYRVVVPEIGAADIESFAKAIGAAGFKEALAREIR